MALFPILLILAHKEQAHFEEWFDAGSGQIYVASDTPANFPTNASHYLSYPEALRQFALLTSTEGWYVLEDHGWHDYIDAHPVEVNSDQA